LLKSPWWGLLLLLLLLQKGEPEKADYSNEKKKTPESLQSRQTSPPVLLLTFL
jgi:hypothetical protein